MTRSAPLKGRQASASAKHRSRPGVSRVASNRITSPSNLSKRASHRRRALLLTTRAMASNCEREKLPNTCPCAFARLSRCAASRGATSALRSAP
ncbi:conserved hypothetical protein [Ricinus communis]|uniref:Uncharacterized protein n=1 Tax=Ricinus communis TaxID=3988 RepID=B9TKA5_RICCO|nr:conserved hypothetical protein [Ricinus communis]